MATDSGAVVGTNTNSAVLQNFFDHLNGAVESFANFLKQYCPDVQFSYPLIGTAIGTITACAALMYFLGKKKNDIYLEIEPLVDLQKQSVEVSNEHARVSSLIGTPDNLKGWMFDDAKTLYESFRRGAKLSKTGECLGYRAPKTTNGRKAAGPYKWITYSEVVQRSENLARGFAMKGLKPGQNTFVGIYAQNQPEWIIAEQACYFYSMVIVPLYDTLGPDACSYIISQAEIGLVVVDKSKKAVELLKKHSDCPSLRIIVLLQPAESDLTTLAEQRGVEIIPFTELEKIGQNAVNQAPPSQPPTRDDLSTISYTSGTTGPPKGVMLTHGNVIADCTSVSVLKYSTINSDDVLLSFLPLAHMFERIIEAIIFSVGARIGYFSGDIRNLLDDLQTLRPTLFVAVPRVLNRVYDKVTLEVNAGPLKTVKKYLLEKAISVKTEQLKRSIVRNNTIWDKLILKRVRNGMGGRVRLMVTGSAPLAPEILTFIRASLGCVVLEGYGQTECVAACSVSVEGDHVPGHVGPPAPCCQIKLVDVPEMNYFANDNKGEVCIKGYNVFKGYYKDPEKTADTLDADGWLHTGDIGLWTKEGTLKLIDRKKHIFKLAQGEYIAPEKIESIYARSKFVGQIFVHGESLKSCLIAIVSPDVEVLKPYAKKEMQLDEDMVKLCKDERVKKLILKDMKDQAEKGGLQSFEQVKDIYLFPEPFTVENGLLTPTMKTKRPAVKERFNDEVSRMYEKLW